MTDPITTTPASPEPTPKHISPTIPLVRALSRSARHSRVALAELREVAAGQTVRRDLHQVLANQHVLLANEADAEQRYSFSIHHTYRRIAKAPQGSRAIRRLAAREVARADRRTNTDRARGELFSQLLVTPRGEKSRVLTPEEAERQEKILRKLGLTPSTKRPLTTFPVRYTGGDMNYYVWKMKEAESLPALEAMEEANDKARAALSKLSELRQPVDMPADAQFDILYPSSSR